MLDLEAYAENLKKQQEEKKVKTTQLTLNLQTDLKIESYEKIVDSDNSPPQQQQQSQEFPAMPPSYPWGKSAAQTIHAAAPLAGTHAVNTLADLANLLPKKQ
jgi:hypothetical protein